MSNQLLEKKDQAIEHIKTILGKDITDITPQEITFLQVVQQTAPSIFINEGLEDTASKFTGMSVSKCQSGDIYTQSSPSCSWLNIESKYTTGIFINNNFRMMERKRTKKALIYITKHEIEKSKHDYGTVKLPVEIEIALAREGVLTYELVDINTSKPITSVSIAKWDMTITAIIIGIVLVVLMVLVYLIYLYFFRKSK